MFGAQVTRYGVARRGAGHGVTIGTRWHASLTLVYHYLSLYRGLDLRKFLKKNLGGISRPPLTCATSPEDCLLVGDSTNDTTKGLVSIVGRVNGGTKLVQAKTVHH